MQEEKQVEKLRKKQADLAAAAAFAKGREGGYQAALGEQQSGRPVLGPDQPSVAGTAALSPSNSLFVGGRPVCNGLRTQCGR